MISTYFGESARRDIGVKWLTLKRNPQCVCVCVCVLSESWKLEPTKGLRPLRRDSDRKYTSRSLRLSNNNIKDLHDLFRPVNHFLSEPSMLSWLDLSFNQISHIHSVTLRRPPLHLFCLHADSWLTSLFLCCRCCASCVSCVCCISMETPSSSCRRCTAWPHCHIYTPSPCTATW